MARLVKVRDWNDNFEVAQSRKIEGPLTWVAMPTKHDGKSYRRIMALPNGPEIYAAWCIIVQVAAKQKRRGELSDDDGPLTPFDIHLKTAFPETLIEEAINVLSRKEIGWLLVSEVVSVSQPTSSVVALHDRQDITNKTDTSAPPEGGCPSELSKLIGWWNELKQKSLVHSGVSADPPSEAVRRGWSRVQRSALLREKLANLERLTDVIRKATFCREGWFRLEKLLGGKNREGEFIVVKLLEGGYDDSRDDGMIPPAERIATPDELASWNPATGVSQ